MHLMRRSLLGLGLALALLAFSACPKPPGEQAGGGTSSSGGGSTGGGTSANWGSAPDLTFTDYDGVSHKLSDYAGEPVVINFWAVW